MNSWDAALRQRRLGRLKEEAFTSVDEVTGTWIQLHSRPALPFPSPRTLPTFSDAPPTPPKGRLWHLCGAPSVVWLHSHLCACRPHWASVFPTARGFLEDGENCSWLSTALGAQAPLKCVLNEWINHVISELEKWKRSAESILSLFTNNEES